MRGVTRILGRSLTRSWIGASRARACACRPALGALGRVEPLPSRAVDQPAQPRDAGEAPGAPPPRRAETARLIGASDGGLLVPARGGGGPEGGGPVPRA